MSITLRLRAVVKLGYGAQLLCMASACGSDAPLAGTGGEATARPGPAHLDAGTGETGERASAVSSMYDRLLEIARERAAFMCRCEVPAEQSITQCVQQTTSPPAPPIVACTKVILAQDERSLEPLECELENYEVYLACVNESTCEDFEHILDCDIARLLRAEECPPLPWDIWAENKRQCEGIPQPAAFECENGEFISSEWVCDHEADCTDASDEVGCSF